MQPDLPASAADEWQQFQDEQGYWYYYNARTGASQYETPYDEGPPRDPFYDEAGRYREPG